MGRNGGEEEKRPRARGLPPFRIKGQRITQTGIAQAPLLAHWMGALLALHGVPVGMCTPSQMRWVLDEWDESPLGRFVQWIEDVDVLMILHYEALHPGRSTEQVVAAVSSFVVGDGSLWVMSGIPLAKITQRDDVEPALLSYIAALPQYELVSSR